MFTRFCAVAVFILGPVMLLAQSTPSAEGPGATAWVGIQFSTFNPDYGCSKNSPLSCWSNQLFGISPYVTTKHFLFNRIGAEGEARFLHWRGPASGFTQSAYLAGPEIGILRHNQFSFNGKVLIGEARLTLPAGWSGAGTYFAYAPGADLDYRLTRRLCLRADYEFQVWPSFEAIRTSTTTGKGGLTPNGLSIGVSYAFLR